MVLDKREAEVSGLNKLVFLANPSHELRTPLNHMNGYCKITQEELEEESLGHPNIDLSKVCLASDPLTKMGRTNYRQFQNGWQVGVD